LVVLITVIFVPKRACIVAASDAAALKVSLRKLSIGLREEEILSVFLMRIFLGTQTRVSKDWPNF